MENKYEEKVRQRAEELAEIRFQQHVMRKVCGWSEFTGKSDMIHKCIPLARLSVQREAEAYIKANEAHYEGPVNMVRIINELQSLGLVPQKHKP